MSGEVPPKSNNVLNSIRAKILSGGFLVAVGLFAYAQFFIPSQAGVIFKLQQGYALFAFGLLYLTLLISPLTLAFPKFPSAGLLKRGRRALGQLVFFYGALHGGIAFFGQLGGFAGVQFLDNTYRLAIILSFSALCILFLMTITSFDAAVARLTYRRWKLLHRLVYVAGVFLLMHAWMLGSHFADRFGLFMSGMYVALAFLISLEANRFDIFLREKQVYNGPVRIFFSLVTGLFLAFFIWLAVMHGVAVKEGLV